MRACFRRLRVSCPDALEHRCRARPANHVEIFLRLQQNAECFVDRICIERVLAESDERGYPIDRFRHPWHLIEVFGPHLLHHRSHLRGEPRRRAGSTLVNDRDFLVEGGIFNPLIQAPALERVVHFARAVRREDHQWTILRAYGAKLRDRNLKFRKQLEEEPLELFVCAIDFVNQQHGRTGATRIDRLEQRALDKKGLAVQIAPCRFPIECSRRLENTQLEELTPVVPLIQSVADVEAFVTLQANEIASERSSGRCRKRGLADARLPFEKQWPLQAKGQKERNRKSAVCDVMLI